MSPDVPSTPPREPLPRHVAIVMDGNGRWAQQRHRPRLLADHSPCRSLTMETPDRSTRILAIETSCDETAAAVIADGVTILSSVVASQIDLHARYGGVFPELASRRHVEVIYAVVEEAMSYLIRSACVALA